jgi:hypothetical protein
LFIARFCCRHLKGAVKVRPSAQSANSNAQSFSKRFRSTLDNTDVLSRQHSNFSLANGRALELELLARRKVGEGSAMA